MPVPPQGVAIEQAVKDAQASADTAYQALVELTGANLAAELTGRRAPNRRATTARNHDDHQPQEQKREATFA